MTAPGPPIARRRADRSLLAALVVVIFIGIGANSVVMSVVLDQGAELAAQGERLERLARAAKTTAAAAEAAAKAARATSDELANAVAQRTGVVDDTINRINAELARGLAAHDLNAHRDHEELRRRLGVTSPLPTQPPITASPPTTTAPVTAATTTTTTTRPAATTTTTRCPKLPNGRCRP